MEGSRVASTLAWGIILISSVGSTIVFGSPISGMQEPGEGLRRILHLRSGIGESACFLQINNHGRVDAVPRQTIYSKYVGPEYEPRHEGYAQKYFSLRDCVLKSKKLGNGRDIYYSPKYHFLINLQKTQVSDLFGKHVPSHAQFSSCQNKIPLFKFNHVESRRHRRNTDVDYSDPHQVLAVPRSQYASKRMPLVTHNGPITSPQDPFRINQDDMVNPDDPHVVLDNWRKAIDRFQQFPLEDNS
ncbi:hypothetical protein NDU88_005662 [Pleurodeles waltl]|uniref:Uncharacterized protein n=1 Tax=Pleurodeles waltl TaxID=8319 RepID=A0AAV7SMK1_PLEWA|nr:hypothetical protein NDU88_005662 [Pleurodeles waltl]